MKQVYFAHRGLHDNQSDHPENSMAAFERAVKKGYGIELDVHLTKDKKLVVTHDHVLTRICKEYFQSEEFKKNPNPRVLDLKIEELDYKEFKLLPIYTSKETIPLFQDVLKLVKGRIPLIVEIKCECKSAEITKAVTKMLEHYKGEYCIESFHPLVLKWLRKNKPEIMRGQLATDYRRGKEEGSKIRNFLLNTMVLNLITKPDFIAYNHKYSRNIFFRFYTKVCKIPAFAWTIRSKEELEHARKNFEKFIFEGFEI